MFLVLLLPVRDNVSASGEDMAHARSQLLYILTEAMLGDSLAAEYLLCHLVSKVGRLLCWIWDPHW